MFFHPVHIDGDKNHAAEKLSRLDTCTNSKCTCNVEV